VCYDGGPPELLHNRPYLLPSFMTHNLRMRFCKPVRQLFRPIVICGQWSPFRCRPNSNSPSTPNSVENNASNPPADHFGGNSITGNPFTVLPQGLVSLPSITLQEPLPRNLQRRLVSERVYERVYYIDEDQSTSDVTHSEWPFFPYQIHQETLPFPINGRDTNSFDALPPLLFETYDNNQPGVPNDLLGSEDYTHTNGVPLNTSGLDEAIGFDDLFDFEAFNAAQFPIQDHTLPELDTNTHSESPLLRETNFDQIDHQTEQLFATFNNDLFGPSMDHEILQPNTARPLDKHTSDGSSFVIPNTIEPSVLSLPVTTVSTDATITTQTPPPHRTLAPMPTSALQEVSTPSRNTSRPKRRTNKEDRKRGNNPFGRKGTKRCAHCQRHHQKVSRVYTILITSVYSGTILSHVRDVYNWIVVNYAEKRCPLQSIVDIAVILMATTRQNTYPTQLQDQYQ
jgi:hypothetical protein